MEKVIKPINIRIESRYEFVGCFWFLMENFQKSRKT